MAFMAKLVITKERENREGRSKQVFIWKSTKEIGKRDLIALKKRLVEGIGGLVDVI